MEIIAKHANIAEEKCDLLIVSLFQSVTPLAPAASAVNKAMDGLLADLLKQEGFEGKEGEWFVFHSFGKIPAKKIAVIGLGEKSAFTLDTVRKIGATIMHRAREVKAKTIATVAHGAGVAGWATRDAAEALGEGMRLGAYRFHTYKGTSAKDAGKHDAAKIILCESERGKIAPMERGLEDARILADATILARDLVNTPSMEMTPTKMAEVAREIAKPGSGIRVETLDAKKMRALGMHAALAVGKGSQHEPIGVHLSYKPKGAKKKIAIVGKAVTFDSGGLSLKPADSMMTMKIDMAGAASVIGLFKALSALKPRVEVHGIFLAVENMPSGTAYRPGDVVKAMNGTTIEVLNTDAEGRVTLADALSYAATMKPDAIVDLATLTGACVVALGEDISGLMANDRKLADRLLAAARETGEPVWELPLYEPYGDLIKSKVADIKNIGGRSAGTITAALFLQHFVDHIPWAHLDIAGPSYAEKETRADLPCGGTGCGVRMLMRFLQGF
jgi:leucyl aminopeptidase